MIPYQVEFQAPPRGKNMLVRVSLLLVCQREWERLNKARGLEILNEILMVELEKLYTQDIQLIL